MESLSMTSLQQLCGFDSLQDLSKKPPFWFHSLQCLSKKPPFYRIGVIASGTDTFRVQIGNQWDFRRSGRVFSSLIDSASLVKNSMKPLSYDLRATFIRSRSNLPLQGYVLKVGVGTTSVRTGLRQIGHSRRKRRVCSQASSGDGPSANAGDSTLGEEGKAQDASSPSSSSSFWPSWNSVVKQVDWNKLIFNWRKDEPMWKVPWTGETIFQVMVLWFAAFWVMGSWVLPIAAQVAGFSRHSLSFRGQALYSLITDIAEGTVGIWILRRCLAQFFPLPHGWFPVKWQGKWLTEACWGCLLFPFVNKLSQLNLYLIPLPNLTTSYVEQSMMSRDPIATLLYAIVISVCAPVWEEVIFRGFLLPSMTRYMPLWGAIFVSALAFALAHFSMQRILPLTFLGLVMGFVFVRSKNLLASIVLHSLWNGFAFLELL